MNKRPRFTIVAAACLILVACILFHLMPQEQMYQGKPLHSWINELANRSNMDTHIANEPLMRTASQETAAAAIRHFGADALPALLYTLRDGNEPGALGWLKRFYRTRNLPEVGSGRLEHWQAAAALEVLGTNAVSSIPILSSMLKGPPRDGKAAALALTGMGDEGRKILVQALWGLGRSQTTYAAWAIGQRALPHEDLFLPLLNCVTNAQAFGKPTAAWALARTQLYPEISIPIIITEATRTDCQYPPYYFVPAIAAFKQHARLIIPQLMNRLEDSKPAVRQFAIKAIAELGAAADQCVPTISKLAESDNDRVTRLLAAEVVAQFSIRSLGSQNN